MLKEDLRDAFFLRVEMDDTHWYWLNKVHKKRFGNNLDTYRFTLNGKSFNAKHVSLYLRGIKVPLFNYAVVNTCSVEECVKPEHLEIVDVRMKFDIEEITAMGFLKGLGLNYKQIADVFDLTPGIIKYYLHKGEL